MTIKKALLAAGFFLFFIMAIFGRRSDTLPPMRIGVIFSQTGTMSMSEKPLIDAVALAAEEINAQGGLLGRKVEMVVSDGRSDPDAAKKEAERLIEQEKVSALFACWTSSCRRAVKEVVEKHDHVLFYPLQYEGLEQSPNIVYLGSTPNQQILPGTRWAFDHLGKKSYLIGSDYLFPRAANRIIRDLALVSSSPVLGERYLPLGSDSFDGAIADIRRLQPEMIFNTLNGDSNVSFFKALKKAGLGHLPVMSFSVDESELEAIGKAGFVPAHYAVWGYFQSLPTEENRTFVNKFRARFGQDRFVSDPIESAYDSVRLWASAVRDADNDDPRYVNRSIVRQSVAGPSGVVVVDSSTRHVWKRARIGRAREDGQFDLVYESEESLRPSPFPSYRSMSEWKDIVSSIETGKSR